MPVPEPKTLTATETRYRSRLTEILRADPLIRPVLERARSLALPDWFVTSGAIYQSVWNSLTGKPAGYGLKDIDLIYFEPEDLGWNAEDRVIARATRAFAAAGIEIPVEARNQARVHLWFEKRFGVPYEPLTSAQESLTRYASTTHAVAVRLELDDSMTIAAPYGFADVFAMRLRPNPRLDNRESYREKGERCRAFWPQVEVLAWP